MKIGDIVYSKKFGRGKIISISTSMPIYDVEFENYNKSLHDLGGKCKKGYGYCCSDDKSLKGYEYYITPYKFTKKDLRTGDKLTTRGGAELLYDECGKYFLNIGAKDVACLSDFNELEEDLTMKNREYSIDDIVKVEKTTYTTIFERETEILDEKEKEYLAGVIRPFKDRVKYIVKYESGFLDEKEYILIRYEDGQLMYFPYFKEGTTYKGMEIDKKYTLEELGLD